ncbi:hypothetical protein ACFSW8_14000 [Rubritalea tangerina]|uniref:Uncharacterized protein n=1 Tax=Rubritalea tangerina TaxID=430798 RepID=A0ABW4ZDE2_9BACT
MLSSELPATTHEELLALQKNSATKQPVHDKKKPKYEKVNLPSLLERSDILSNGNIWTLVPKNAILYVPQRLQSKVVSAPNGKFVNWQTFLTKNPAWLSTHPVSLKNSSGSDKIDFETFEPVKQRGKIIVAVHNKGPISVTPGTIEMTKTK